jgi:hypothetical protein
MIKKINIDNRVTTDTGHEYLLAGLAACTSMTLQKTLSIPKASFSCTSACKTLNLIDTCHYQLWTTTVVQERSQQWQGNLN